MILKTVAVISIVVVVAGAIFALAGCRGRKHHGHASMEKRADWMSGRISSELDLSDDQKIRLGQIKDEIVAREDDFRSLKSDLYEAFEEEIQEERIDTGRLNRVFEEKEKRFSEMRAFMVDKVGEFHEMLTVEQRATLAEKMKNFDRRRR